MSTEEPVCPQSEFLAFVVESQIVSVGFLKVGVPGGKLKLFWYGRKQVVEEVTRLQVAAGQPALGTGQAIRDFLVVQFLLNRQTAPLVGKFLHRLLNLELVRRCVCGAGETIQVAAAGRRPACTTALGGTRTEGEACGWQLCEFNVRLFQSKIATKEVPLNTTHVHQIVVGVAHTAAFASEGADVPAQIGPSVFKGVAAQLHTHLAIDSEYPINNRAFYKLLAAGGIYPFAVIVNFPLTHSYTTPVPFGDINTPVDNAGA